MDLDEARELVRSQHRAVLATMRSDWRVLVRVSLERAGPDRQG